MASNDSPLLLLPEVLAHSGLPASAKLLHAVLAARAAPDDTVRATKAWLACQIGLDRRQVYTLLRHLEKVGLLEILRDPSEPQYYRLLSA